MLNLLKYEIQSRIGAIIGWSIGLILFGAMYIAIYPQAGEQMEALSDLSIYQAMGVELGSFEGFIASSVVQFVPIILGIYAIVTSTQTLAGEEDNGTLELIIAMPIPRWQIVSMKALAISVVALIILVLTGIGNALVLNAVKSIVEVDVTGMALFTALVSTWPLIVAFMMIGLFLSAYLPNRRTAALTLTVVFIGSYFGETLAGLVDSLEPIKTFSLFNYFDSSASLFSEGVQSGDVLLLFAVAVLFFILAILAFQRRDVTVGAWPWQRAKVSG